MDIQTSTKGSSSPLDLESQLSCPICLEMFTKPVVILPCQHNLCRGCASDLYDSRTPYHYSGGVFRCPTCRFEVVLDRHGVYGLQRNLLVENIIDVYKEQLEKKGGVEDPSSSSSLDPPVKDRDAAQGPKCPDHPEERINIFCLTCQVPTCSMCKVFGGHKDCEVSPLAAVYQAKKAELRAAVDALAAGHACVQALLARTEEACARVRENGELQKRRLGESFDLLYALLEERKGQLVERIGQEEEEKVAVVRSLADQHKEFLQASGTLKDQMAASAEKGGMAEFLVGSKELIRQAKETAKGAQLQRPEPGYESMDHFSLSTEEVELMLRELDFGGMEEEEDEEEEEEE
ncbi:E3 ubiquitin-protein ligase TRIM63a [Aplochiton taeniatus]